jgi:hypothetical protein
LGLKLRQAGQLTFEHDLSTPEGLAEAAYYQVLDRPLPVVVVDLYGRLDDGCLWSGELPEIGEILFQSSP